MTLGMNTKSLIIGYLRNQQIVSSVDDIDSIQFEVISSGLKVIESLNSNVKISPNPTNANIQIVFKEYNGPFNVEIYDLQGKLLGNYSSNIISLANYKKGVYVMRVHYLERMEELKLIKN